MRVGFDISPLRRGRTGVGNYCYYLLKHLIPLAPDCTFRGFATGLSRVDLGLLHGRLPYRHLPVPTRALYSLWTWLHSPPVEAFLGGLDIYHATNYFLPPTRKARRALTIHDLAFLAVPELHIAHVVGPFAGKLRPFAQAADAILAYSEATKHDVVTHLGVAPDVVTVAPMAVDEAFAPVPRDEAADRILKRYGLRPPYLLFVSTLEPRKNVTGLLRAFRLLTNDLPHTLVLAGSAGWQAQEVFTLVDTLGLSSRVRHLGFIDHLQLPALYCAADALVFPTLYEGFGLPLLEALTCGCPVVTARNSAVPEVTGDAAVYVDPRDPEDIAAGIRTILSNAALRDDLIGRGKRHAETFSWRRCAETTLEVYRRLAAR